MKIILVIVSFLFVNFSTYADGHSGKIHLEGFGAWSLNVMNAGNDNLSLLLVFEFVLQFLFQI